MPAQRAYLPLTNSNNGGKSWREVDSTTSSRAPVATGVFDTTLVITINRLLVPGTVVTLLR